MNLLHYVAMDNCKGVSTHMTSTIVFDPSPHDNIVDCSLYRIIIGKLSYLSFMCPDRTFAFYKLSQAMYQPFLHHIGFLLKYFSAIFVQLPLFNSLIANENRMFLAYFDSNWELNPRD